MVRNERADEGLVGEVGPCDAGEQGGGLARDPASFPTTGT